MHDFREFIKKLINRRKVVTVKQLINTNLEITEISYRALRTKKNPVLLFNNIYKYPQYKVISNLFCSEENIKLSLGLEYNQKLENLGEFISLLKNPDPPSGIIDLMKKFSFYKNIFNMATKIKSKAYFHENEVSGNDINLYNMPIQFCWPKDISPLITWGLVVTNNINNNRYNVGIYRQQLLSHNQVIMRWLPQRGGALDYNIWKSMHPKKKFPIAIIIGADPYTILSSVIPLPDHISEYSFSGLLRKKKINLVKCKIHDLYVPQNSEIILEGFIYPNQYAKEGPFGDHTGYYNDQESFPIVNIEKIFFRNDPFYHTTYTGKPPDEPSIIGNALNKIYVPIIKKQFSEIQDFYLPPEGCSYRIAIISIKKRYPGHARQVMMQAWSSLRQFMYTKYIIICDDDINIRDWKDVMWAISTRADPYRDSLFIKSSTIDYLDFSSPESGLGSKIGIDATNKVFPETKRKWGEKNIYESRDEK